MLTKNIILQNTLQQIRNPLFGASKKAKFGQPKPTNTQSIKQEWRKVKEQNQQKIEDLYNYGKIEDWVECRTLMENDFTFENEIYELLINWLTSIDWRNEKEVKALFYYTEIVSNRDYKPNPLVLLKYHKQLQVTLKELIKKPDFTIISDVNSTNFSKLLENIIELYFFHTSHSWGNKNHVEQYDIDRTEMANLIPEYIKAYLGDISNLVISVLECNSAPINTYADLVLFYMKNDKSIEQYCPLASNLFSEYNEPRDFFYKNASKITALVLKNDLSDKEITYFTKNVLLSQLGITNKEDAIQELEKHLEKIKDNPKVAKHIVNTYEKDLIETSTNWHELYAKKENTAIRRIAVSKSTAQSAKMVLKSYPNNIESRVLKNLLEKAIEFQNKPKVYNLNNKPITIFKDLHFKFLVIEELMYKQKVLLPFFDLHIFAKEYTAKEIETDAYEVIPEVKKYFKNLEIPDELLNKVKTLYQDSGLGGGSEFINQMYSNWDPGAVDDVFKVSNKAISDLDLLPNLKEIIGLENSNPSNKLKKILTDRNIRLTNED